jgi:glutamyl-tRNA reductase
VLGDLIIDSNTLKAATPIGTAVGQVSSAANFVFNKAITDATAVRNNGASTYAQMTTSIANLKAATSTFTNSIKK